jgi:hypothetical protein
VSSFFLSALIRSRLSRYFYDRRKQAAAVKPTPDFYSVQNLLDEIVLSPSTNFKDEHSEQVENEATDALSYSLKPESLRLFLSQERHIDRVDVLIGILQFLIEVQYIHKSELTEFYLYFRESEVLRPLNPSAMSQLDINDGEYVLVTNSGIQRSFSCLVVRRDQKTKQTRSLHRNFRAEEKLPIRLDAPRFVSEKAPPEGCLDEWIGFFCHSDVGDVYLIENDIRRRIRQTRVQVLSHAIKINVDIKVEQYVILNRVENAIAEIKHFFEYSKRVVFEDNKLKFEKIASVTMAFPFNILKYISDFYELCESLARKLRANLKKVITGYIGNKIMRSMNLDQDNLTQALFVSVRQGDIRQFFKLLVCGADIAHVDPQTGNTVLHVAASNGQFQLLEAASDSSGEVQGSALEFCEELAQQQGFSLEIVKEKLKEAISRSPIAAKNFDGLSPSAYIGPVKMEPSSAEERRLHSAWQNAMDREAKAVITPENWTYAWMDYVLDNKFGRYMPYMGTTPPRL